MRNIHYLKVDCYFGLGGDVGVAIVEVMFDRFRYNSASGKLFTWGDGDEGRLGHVDNGNKIVPTRVTQLVDYDFVQVSCGRMLTVALTNMGKVFAMGSAKYGQLGNPHARDKVVIVVRNHIGYNLLDHLLVLKM